MSLPPFAWQRAEDLGSALSALADGALPYCGGTELLAAMGMGLVSAERLVSLRGVAELRGVALEGDVLHVGATTTHREVAGSEVVASAFPLLARVAERVGNVRVRASGTIGGNLAFAEPRSDISTLLIAAGASVVVTDGGAQRRVAVEEFLLGPFEPDLEPEELLVGVEVPVGAADVGAYHKVTVTERPVVGVALVPVAAAGGWRLVVGAVGDEPLVVEAASLAEVDADGVAGEVDVVADLAGSEAYKRQLTRVAVAACRDEARARSQEA